jgi:hypothetical protein
MILSWQNENAAACPSPPTLSTILDHDQVVLLGKRHEPVHIAGPSRMVHGDDGSRFRGEDRLDRLGRHVLRLGRHVRKHRRRARPHDAARGSDERARRNNDLISRSNTRRLNGKLECKRAIRQRDRVLGIAVISELALEGLTDLACPVVHLSGG